ncbi:hypothetical protein GCM10011416_12680 [Polaribacter pacificus]|uniref:TonB C-terminal domain-containing protein n=1 Tax=Polaribacter pacificus TaxID=1775173 RepID=A0A917MDD1_9FLAO|nr:energy transducer TonB [Polaribacter pacificus]GGG96385.1 hypothetical protein GCM10011416_12680 [Polaribacter pacificus]
MKVLFFLLFFGMCTVFGQESDATKVYTLSEVDVAPLLPKLKLVDSLSSKENFKKNLFYQVIRNVDIVRSNDVLRKVHVEFLIKKDGSIEILRVKGETKAVKAAAVRAIKEIKRMTPAQKNSQPVAIKYIVPVTFEPLITIDLTRQYE